MRLATAALKALTLDSVNRRTAWSRGGYSSTIRSVAVFPIKVRVVLAAIAFNSSSALAFAKV